MNIKRLETFYWAVRLGSFKAAANKLNSTQSTVSMRIQELERELAVVLFDRTHGAARPNLLGLELMEDIERILHSVNMMQDRISSAESVHGRIRIGVAEVVSLTWLPQLMWELRKAYPLVRFEIEEALTQKLESELDAGNLDIVLAPGGATNSRHHVVPTGAVEFAWMASPSLGLAGKEHTPADLLKVPLIILSEESFHTATIEQWFGGIPTRPEIMSVCKSMSVAASLAQAGLGMTLLPVCCFTKVQASKRLELIQTTTSFPIIPFRALVPRPTINKLALSIAHLAAEVSINSEKAEMIP